MSESEILEKIQKILHDNSLDCSIEKESQENPWPMLLLFGGNDDQNREKIISIMAQEQEIGQELTTSPETAPVFVRLQFQYTFPFLFQDAYLQDLCSFLLYLNEQIELPGFGLDHVNNRLYYRYIMLNTLESLNPLILLSTVGVIMLLIDVFSPPMEKLAKGETTFNDILKEILSKAQTQ